jgi:hypothetical protein
VRLEPGGEHLLRGMGVCLELEGGIGEHFVGLCRFSEPRSKDHTQDGGDERDGGANTKEDET